MYTADNVTVKDVLDATQTLVEKRQKIDVAIADLKGEPRPHYGQPGHSGASVSMQVALERLHSAKESLAKANAELEKVRAESNSDAAFKQAAEELNALRIGRLFEDTRTDCE